MSASVEIRIYPGKEMFAADMAETLRAALVDSGRLNGCRLSCTDGVMSITDGRIAISGRIGVVRGGTIATPTVSSSANCMVVAICDLSRESEPMRIEILSPADYATLQNNAKDPELFNDSGTGIQYVVLGTAFVNATTGKVTSWGDDNQKASSSDAYDDIMDLLTWKKIETKTGRVDMDVPSDAKELYITVQATYSSTVYYHVNMHLLVCPELFRSDGKEAYSVNYYGTDSNGYVSVSTRVVLPTARKIKLASSNTGNTDATSSAVWTVYYR